MKALILFVAAICILSISMAQTPQAFKYQAVIRDLNGAVIPGKSVSLRIGIIPNSVYENPVYSEQHECISNSFGLIDLEIGNGILLSGNFSSINWAAGNYFIKIELDSEGGSIYRQLGISQLLSVPYSMYAEKAGNGFSGNYNDLTNRPVIDGSETKIIAGNNVSVTGNGTSGNPYQINSSPTHFVGEKFGGGIVFYVDRSGQHGLIVSMKDLGPEKWSNAYDSIGVAASSPWNGESNSNAILLQSGHSSSAAKLCNDYVNADYGNGVFSDWFLPAINQLTLLYSNIYEVNKILESDANSATQTIFYKPYWSSTENQNIFAMSYAYYFNFETFVCDRYSKSNPLQVRAIRNF